MTTKERKFHRSALHAFAGEGDYVTNHVKQTVRLRDGRLFAFNGYDRFYEIGTGDDCIEVKL